MQATSGTPRGHSLRAPRRLGPRCAGVLAAVFVVLLSSLLSSGGPRRGGWAGDPRVNVPIADLAPHKVRIVAAPFPLADLVDIADAYAAPSLPVNFPESSSNITLRLDARGLQPVDLRHFVNVTIPQRHGPSFYLDRIQPVLSRLTEDPAPLVSAANISFTLLMMDQLWRRLVDEGLGLLGRSLGEQHSEYAALSSALAPPPDPVPKSLEIANHIWGRLQDRTHSWSHEATGWLDRIRAELGAAIIKVGQSPQEDYPTFGARAPTLQHLLEYAEAKPPIAGRNRTLPQLLRGVRLSDYAANFLWDLSQSLSDDRRPPVKETASGCSDLELLEEVAQGRCYNKTSLSRLRKRALFKLYPLDPFASVPAQDDLEVLRYALCDAEEFLGPLGAGAERVRDRLRAAIPRRSLYESLTGNFRHSLQGHLAVLEGLIDLFHPLYSALKLQRRILADTAREMHRACLLQDAMRVRFLGFNKTSLWRLEWNNDTDAAVITWVTLPDPKVGHAYLESELARMRARKKGLWGMDICLPLLRPRMLDGWLERLGLDRQPYQLSWKETLSSSLKELAQSWDSTARSARRVMWTIAG